MSNSIERQAILTKFINDERTSKCVFDEMRESFLKSRGTKDVHVLAGERIAIELLDKAIDKITSYREVNGDKSTGNKQFAL